MRRLAFLLVLALSAGASAQNKVYRWQDAQGTVHYGQVPPASGAYEAVHPRTLTPAAPAPASPAANAADATADAADPVASAPTEAAPPADDAQRFLEEAEAAARTRNDAREAAEQARRDRDGACLNAQRSLRFMEELGVRRLATPNADGSVSRMDDADYETRIERARRDVQTNCR